MDALFPTSYREAINCLSIDNWIDCCMSTRPRYAHYLVNELLVDSPINIAVKLIMIFYALMFYIYLISRLICLQCAASTA